jgi:hypothetical protein
MPKSSPPLLSDAQQHARQSSSITGIKCTQSSCVTANTAKSSGGWALEVLGEQVMLDRLDSWAALAQIGYVLLVSSDCSHDPFDPSGRCSYSWQVWGMFPEGVLKSDKPEEWEHYLEFPCKTKCIGGGGALWSSDCEVHSFGGETPGVTAAMPGVTAAMAGLVPAALRKVTVVQVVDNMGVKDVHPKACRC